MAALDPSTIVAVVGAGTMGAGIAQVAALAGHPVRLHDARPGARLAFFFTKRKLAQMTGLETAGMLEPLRMYAHIPRLLNAYGRLEHAESKLDILSPRQRALAELKSATTVRCEYCIDLGSQIARQWGLSDEELRAMADYRNAACFSDVDKLILEYATAISRTPVEVTDEAMNTVRSSGADLVVALGGGAAVGLGKALSARTGMPQIAVPTTYAGSEMTPVLGETRDGRKTTRRDLSLAPGTVVYDPELTLTMSPGLTLTSALNALAHAFPDGKGGAVDIKVRESGPDNVEMVFSDDGCGMSADVRRKAFDPFFTTRRDQGGTGLGLHIVYNIVTSRLGGHLDLDSRSGEGTRIRIILPRVAPMELAAE